MTSVAEAMGAKTELAGDLAAGVESLSLSYEATFTRYAKVVLPLDGFVFWVRADLLSASALLDAAALNNWAFNQAQAVVGPAQTIVAKGSLHYATSRQQDEDQTLAVNQVVFTSEVEIEPLNAVGPGFIYIATFDGLRVAFAQRGRFYKQAGLHHYVGNAVYASMATQVVDDPRLFWNAEPVVSNSLPLWLALNGYEPLPGSPACPVRLYPSFAVPDNLPPPYGAVHVVPESTRAIAGSPFLDSRSSHSQLCRELVRITLYGLRNFQALDFQDCVNQYSFNTDNVGLMSAPVVRDDKRAQPEIAALAMRKTIEFEVSYLQATARDVARQIIARCVPTFQLAA